MMESEAYQNLIDRLERIEKYVVRATERQAALDDEDVWLDNELKLSQSVVLYTLWFWLSASFLRLSLGGC